MENENVCVSLISKIVCKENKKIIFFIKQKGKDVEFTAQR